MPRASTPNKGYTCEDCKLNHPESVHTFAKKCDLTRHMKSGKHLKERNFQCPQCVKAFATKSQLGTHLRTHSGAATIKCGYCDRGFKDYRQRIDHWKREHPDEPAVQKGGHQKPKKGKEQQQEGQQQQQQKQQKQQEQTPMPPTPPPSHPENQRAADPYASNYLLNGNVPLGVGEHPWAEPYNNDDISSVIAESGCINPGLLQRDDDMLEGFSCYMNEQNYLSQVRLLCKL